MDSHSLIPQNRLSVCNRQALIETCNQRPRFDETILIELRKMHFSLLTSSKRSTRVRLLFLILLTSGIVPLLAQNRNEETLDTRVQQLLVRGLTRLYLEDFEGAVSVFDQALKVRPNDPALLSSMVQAQMGLGEFSSARFFIERAISADDGNTAIWELSAELSMATGAGPTLLKARQELVRLRPGSVTAHLDLIRLLSRLERTEDAVGASRIALKQAGEDPRILMERVTLFEKLGRASELDRTLLRLIEMEPADLSTRIQLGASYIRQSKWKNAESAFRSILALESDHLEAGTSLSVVLTHMGRGDEAQALLAEIVSLNRAGVSGSERQFDLSSDEALAAASEDQLETWLTEHPTHTEALKEFAKRLMARGDALKAAELYSNIVATDPRELEIWVAAIGAFVEAEDFERALEIAGKGLALFPGYAPLRIEQAKALVGAGRTEAALTTIQELLNQVKDPYQKTVLTALLEQIEGM